MGRLTKKEVSGKWQVNGISWEKLQKGETITEDVSQRLYGCLCKPKDYEDSGMSPDQLESWQHELTDMAVQACDKLCRHPREIAVQEDLDAICENCLINACVDRIYVGE